MKNIFLIVFVLTTQSIFAQDKKYPFEKWDEQVKKEAATAENTTYIGNKEKELVFLINLVRNNPKLYWETYAQKYIDENNIDNNSFLKSLKKELYEAKTVQYLIPDVDLQKMSDELALSQEKNGKAGHDKFNERIEKLPVKFKNSRIAENLYYGPFEPEHVIMSWLIDDGVNGVEHRKAILNPRNKFIGITVKPHKKQKNVVVMDFANQSYWE